MGLQLLRLAHSQARRQSLGWQPVAESRPNTSAQCVVHDLRAVSFTLYVHALAVVDGEPLGSRREMGDLARSEKQRHDEMRLQEEANGKP